MDSRSIAAIGPDRAWVEDYRGLLAHHDRPEAPGLDALAAWATARNIRAVWLCDGHGYATGSPGWWVVARPRYARHTAPQGLSVPTVARVREHYAARPEVLVYDLAERHAGRYALRDTRWPWFDEPSPRRLLSDVRATEAAFGAPLGASPGAMAVALMHTTTLGHEEWLACNLPDSPPSATATAPRWCAYPAALLNDPPAFVHVWDTNAAYLAAAQSTALGCGALREREADPGSHAGIYLLDGNLLGPVVARPGWYDAATVRAARLLRQPLGALAPAWVWDGAHQTLRAWADRLWAIRSGATGRAAEAAKLAYVAGLGRLNASTAGDAGSRWYRPLWYAAIVAEAGRRQWATVARLRACGHWPVLLDTDTIAVVSDSAVDLGAILPHQPGRLGKYKHIGSYRFSPALGAMLREGALDAALAWIGRQERIGHAA